MNTRRVHPAIVVCALAGAMGLAAPRAPRPPAQPRAQVALPNKPDTLHFAVIGDNGTGERPEYELAQQIVTAYERFPFPLVVMMGDNLYGSERPQDFMAKFETPYKALLDRGVKFYACLGNHDSREQRYYKPFNMDGRLYYSFKAPKESVRFFALESTYMDRDQLQWIDSELSKAGETWKIVYFHHPLYSSGLTHGSTLKLREVLEPLFIKYNVTLVLSGHDHVYERIKPQNGIQYFVEGSSGQLRDGDLRKPSPLTASGFDTDRTFMLMEIDGDTLTFNTVSRQGAVVDSGTMTPRK